MADVIHGPRTTHLVPPGDTCPTCSRRVPHPKKATSPTTRPIAYRAPLDEYEAHLEVIDAVAELLGVKSEKFHRYKAISYAMAAVVQHGLRVDVAEEEEHFLAGHERLVAAMNLEDWCFRCGQEAAHKHHRKLRSQGGDNSPANLIRVCAECHDWIHYNPAEAYEQGYLVKSWQNPEDVEIGG